MSTTESETWLRAGVAALKAGRREQARTLLLKVIEADKRHEKGWLWLSGAVETDEDRRLCLENVLTLNPHNQAARQGLMKLGIDPDRLQENDAVTATPQWPAPATPKIHYIGDTAYDDIWASNRDLCAYCAHEVSADKKRCPGCKRDLIATRYRYADPSSNLHILWVIMIGLGQLLLLQLFFDVTVERNWLNLSLYLALSLLLFGLAVCIYLRQPWAHLATAALLCTLLLIMLTTLLAPFTLDGLGLDRVDPAIAEVAGGVVGYAGGFLRVLQTAAVVLALYYALFKVAPDFERAQERRVATLTKGLSEAGDYHLVARRLAQAGMWASAVLHWQRAAAREPTQFAYQRRLGQAYARLGFYRRSLDVLQSAHDMSSQPQTQAEIMRLIQWVRQQMALSEASAERSASLQSAGEGPPLTHDG